MPGWRDIVEAATDAEDLPSAGALTGTEYVRVERDGRPYRTNVSALGGGEGAGTGDMLAATYDPEGVAADVYDVDNHVDGTNNKVFTAAEKTKLTAIEPNATADMTGAEIATAYEGEADRNAYTDAEKAKLATIAEGAQVNPTAAAIKTAYESNADTNAYTDADAAAVAGLGALASLDTVSLAALPAGSTIDVFQGSDGTWPARPTARTDIRVNWIGYPGETDTPSGAVEGLDTYMLRAA